MKPDTSKATARPWHPTPLAPIYNVGLDGVYRMGQITMAPSAVLGGLEKARLVDPLIDEVRRLREMAALSPTDVRHVEEQADRLIRWDALVAERDALRESRSRWLDQVAEFRAERDRLRAALLEYVQRQEAECDPSGLPEYEQGRAALEGRAS